VSTDIERNDSYLWSTANDSIAISALGVEPGSTVSYDMEVTVSIDNALTETLQPSKYYIGVQQPVYLKVNNGYTRYLGVNGWGDIEAVATSAGEFERFNFIPEAMTELGNCIADRSTVSVQLPYAGELYYWYTGEYNPVKQFYKVNALNSNKPSKRDAHFQLINLSNPGECLASGDEIYLHNSTNGFITTDQQGVVKTTGIAPEPMDFGARIIVEFR
ncbi:hypothetical protein LCGC14_3095170, partial [marine sediment metagenome]